MRILGLGVDAVEVGRIRRAAGNVRFCARVFTAGERMYCQRRGCQQYQSLAARWAAKEAVFKACGQAWPGMSWHDAEVVNDDRGKPRLVASGGLVLKLREMRVSEVWMSWSHTRELAVAQVILLGE
ncbi:MAG: holo-ACP synthase [Negativicutes bacterium]|nr:holo-ACP synthase [Negativicutes bacterium]